CLAAGAPSAMFRTPMAQDNLELIIDSPVLPDSNLDPRNEPSIAVSPVSDSIIVGASKVILGAGGRSSGDTRVAYYSSSDGGLTWVSSLLGLETPQKNWSRATDPSVAADLEGNFYLCVLMLDAASFDTGVYVYKSTDGGVTFVEPIPVVADIGNPTGSKRADKCYIAVDRSASSLFRNTVYAIWVSSEPDRTVILTSHRRPGEAGFSEPKTISHSGDMRGPSITTGPNGELYAAWQGIGNPRVILFNASTDGGETFLPLEAAPSIDLNIHDFTGSLSPPDPALIISGVSRMNSFPVIDVDRSLGPHRGMIYVAWAETINGTDSDIFVKRLTPPNGARPAVSPAVRVSDDNSGANQFFPWLSVDDANGSIKVAFYDRRDDPGGPLVNMYVARSTDGGVSFAGNARVSVEGSDPRIQSSVTGGSGFPIGIGDYIGLAASYGRAHILWTDTRRGKQEIFFGRIPFEPDAGGNNGPANDRCQNAKTVGQFFPIIESLDTTSATSTADDPQSCSGGQDTHSVWYRFTSPVDTVHGVQTLSSHYDTVVSVYTGTCGSLTRVACNDDFSSMPVIGNRSLLTFSAKAGTTYLIEVSGKGSGGRLFFQLGGPAITNVEFKKAPDKSKALRITGAGFIDGDSKVIIRDLDLNVTELPMTFYSGERQQDGTVTVVFGTMKKLKKLVVPGKTFGVEVKTPASGFGNTSNTYLFTRQ
ncbi:MAG TPA: sialidase family protein, partial [Blastocatellia bacterium]|nr:sialidase family protein [Blastocatellia bacterium]